MFYFKDNNALTVYFTNGDVAVWNSNNTMYNKIYDMCIANEWIKIETLHNQIKTIMTSDNVKVSKEGNIIINKDNESITIESNESNSLLSMIKLLQDKGTIKDDIEKVKPFLLNMLENPYIDAVHEIYEYCKAMDFEITEDGCFLAYKNVKKDYSSLYDRGKTKHALNEYTEVTKFNTNRTDKCSYGLHFCSKSYLNSYGGEVTIIVKINPKDVVSIPTDYNFAKGRCKRYMMVGVMAKNGTLKTTNLEAVTKEKIVKTPAKKRDDKKEAKVTASNRITETAEYMTIYDNDINKVAKVMNISSETVRRNLRKFRQKEKESS